MWHKWQATVDVYSEDKKTGITNAGSLFVYYLYAFNRVFQIELRGKGVPLVEGIKILLEELHYYVVRI